MSSSKTVSASIAASSTPPTSSSLSWNCRVVGDELSRRVIERRRGEQDGRLSNVACAFIARLGLLQARSARQRREAAGEDEEGEEEDDGSISLLPPQPSLSPFLHSLDDSSLDWESHRLSSSNVDLWVDGLLPSLLSLDHPLLSTVRMQVDFELRYALQSHLHHLAEAERKKEQQRRVQEALTLSQNITEVEQKAVPAFYSALFALSLHSDGTSPQARDERKLQREVAAALESVFPLPHLFAMAEKGEDERKAELLGLPALVRGIRLFNRQLHKGGEGLTCDGEEVRGRNEELQRDIERESALIGDIAQSYADVVHLWREEEERGGGKRGTRKGREEEEKEAPLTTPTSPPPSPFSRGRVHCELIHRRQYLLFLHSLQADGVESTAALHSAAKALASLYSQLTAIVGLRSSVPKHSVFPLFQEVAGLYDRVVDEDRRVRERRDLFSQLQLSRNPFITALSHHNIQRAREAKRRRSAVGLTPQQVKAESFEWVRTITDEDDVGALDASTCVRVCAQTSSGFMALPLVYQGYCCVTLVQNRGFLLPGDPQLGLIRYGGQYFAFADAKAMREFVGDPAAFIRSVEVDVIPAFPSLLHLLVLQPRFPHTDVAHYLTNTFVQQVYTHQQQQRLMQSSAATAPATSGTAAVGAASTSASLFPPVPPATRSASTQTPTHFPTADAAAATAGSADSVDGGLAVSLAGVHWNEWEMRRRAVQMANLTRSRTHSTQTNLSHYRRENSSQYTLAERDAEGVAVGKGSQTRVDVATNSERHHHVLAGLRKASEHGTTQLTRIPIILPPIVQQPTNPDLRG